MIAGWLPLLVMVVPHVMNAEPRPAPLAHTYSIVARDPATGELGVAVQSHYFSVGPIVPWAEAGVGAVATQSLVRVEYGPEGLALMRAGASAQQALDSLVAADPHNEGRQVAMIDARGGVAVYTGPRCIPFAGHQTGGHYSCQANLMASEKVWPAMAAAFEKAQGDLAERLMQVLEAAEKEGGDIRGRQSAAILVVRGTPTGKPWQDRLFDLRVEDSPRPLEELRRLMRLRRAYRLEDEGDEFMAQKKLAEAQQSYEAAMKLAPEIAELKFWAAVSMYPTERKAEALKIFRELFARESQWADLVPRLAQVGLFPNDSKALAEVEAQRPRGRMEKRW